MFDESHATEAGASRLLAGLNEGQRAAVELTTGPLAIVAGAGSGKTRVISHRAAYAIETRAVRADRILLVTFTDKAATEMVARMRALGQPRVMARTFHAFALAQLRHFWPSRHEGAALPELISSKTEILFRLARGLPGHYRFAAPRDLAETIEWAKVRRIRPADWEREGGDRAPIPADLFARLYGNYERTKDRAGRIDFEDMLLRTVDLLEDDDEAAAIVQGRKSWFSVDEYQDTNPLAERLLELWLGDSRDLAVVGDPDQTIYTFTGATPDYLLNFEGRHPGARTVNLVENYRSTPQILELANRLVGRAAQAAAEGAEARGPTRIAEARGASPRPPTRAPLQTTQPSGPPPSIRRHADDGAERRTMVEEIHRLLGEGLDPAEIAILVRINAQLPELEQALTRAGIPFRVRGQRFFERSEVRDARRLLRRARPTPVGPALLGAVRNLFIERLGMGHAAEAQGDESRERTASLELLLDLVRDVTTTNPEATIDSALAELDRRDEEEATGSGNGVNILTYHRAKGLEWDAVFLPALEEGLLPIRQAKDDESVAEERRLLYVGITRARRHLTLSWAARRVGSAGKEAQRKPSRFLGALESRAGDGARPSRNSRDPRSRDHADGDGEASPGRRSVAAVIAATEPIDGEAVDRRVLQLLQRWRRDRSTRDGVPSYVVAHDATLFAIVEASPGSLTALGRVSGMGPVKVERYGPEILAIIARAEEPEP